MCHGSLPPVFLPGQCGPAQDFGLGTLTLMHLTTTNPLRPKDSCSVWLCFIEMIHLWVFPEKCKWMWWKLKCSKPTFQSIIHRYMIYVRYIYPLHVGYSLKMNGSGNVICKRRTMPRSTRGTSFKACGERGLDLEVFQLTWEAFQ